MITIAELFPLHSTCCKWLETFRPIKLSESKRLIKEYIVHYQDRFHTDRYRIDNKYNIVASEYYRISI